MAEQTTAASSTADQEDVFRGEHVSHDEFSHYRQTGELPARFKPAETADSAPADAPEQTVVDSESDELETDPDSEPEEAQEQPKPGSGAEKRIKQLLAEKKELQRKLEAAKPTSTDSSPAPAANTPPPTRPRPTPEDKSEDGTPKFKSYEDFVNDLAYWNGEQLLAKYKREQVEQDALKSLKVKLDDARTRYEDADDTIFPTAQAIKDARIPQVVKDVLAESDVFIDLCYVLGSDPDDGLKKLITLAQTNPRAALAKVFEYERGIREEFAQPDEPETKQAPEKRQTAAPKPPSPVGGGSTRSFDVNDETISADDWMRKRNAQVAKAKGLGRS